MGGWGLVCGGVLKALTFSSRSITASGGVVGDGAGHSSDVVAVAICLDRQIRYDIIKIIIWTGPLFLAPDSATITP